MDISVINGNNTFSDLVHPAQRHGPDGEKTTSFTTDGTTAYQLDYYSSTQNVSFHSDDCVMFGNMSYSVAVKLCLKNVNDSLAVGKPLNI